MDRATKQLREKLDKRLLRTDAMPTSLNKPNHSKGNATVKSDEHSKYPPVRSGDQSGLSASESQKQTTTETKRKFRRPFTAAEDEALIQGYAIHGFHWSSIQQDRCLNLGHRKAAHLRDRFRTKFAEVYQEGGPLPDNKQPRSSATGDSQAKYPTMIDSIRQGSRSNGDKTSKKSQATETTNNKRANNNNNNNGSRQIQTTTGPSHASSGSGSLDPGVSLPAPLSLLEPLLPPPQPQSSSPAIFTSSAMATVGTSRPFGSLYENQASTAANPAVDTTVLEDNTLPPLAWDELA